MEGRGDLRGADPNDTREARRHLEAAPRSCWSPMKATSCRSLRGGSAMVPPPAGRASVTSQGNPTAIPRRQSGFPDWRTPDASLTIPGRASLRDTRSSTGPNSAEPAGREIPSSRRMPRCRRSLLFGGDVRAARSRKPVREFPRDLTDATPEYFFRRCPRAGPDRVGGRNRFGGSPPNLFSRQVRTRSGGAHPRGCVC